MKEHSTKYICDSCNTSQSLDDEYVGQLPPGWYSLRVYSPKERGGSSQLIFCSAKCVATEMRKQSA